MAKNDIILIDGIIQERCDELLPSNDNGEVFEFLACEQVLKKHDLSKDEIIQGNVDGKDDGGIDALYFFVNGNIILDTDTLNLPKSNCSLDVVIITCKHHNTFKQEVVNNQCASIAELFDFSKDNSQFIGAYNDELLDKINLLKHVYSLIASKLDKSTINYYYCSRGDSSEVGDNIVARASQIQNMSQDYFSNASSEYFFYGSSEILSLYRKRPPIVENIPIIDRVSGDDQCSVVLCKLTEYFKLISDENNNLKRYLFDSNVRDYMGNKGANADIMSTLCNGNQSADFWWFNNGITILSTSAVNIGKNMQVENVQIVNGLQTSLTIYQYFIENSDRISSDSRSVMIKIIAQTDESIRDQIIRSTNNQTTIELKSLFATDKLQRDIEDILKKNDLYYERRVNYYANQGISSNVIFDIMYLASGYIGLVLKQVDRAANLKQKQLKVPEKYDLIFNEKEDLRIWPIIAIILRRTDNYILRQNRLRNNKEKMAKRSRCIVAMITIGRILGKYNFNSQDLIASDIATLFTEEELIKTWDFMYPYYEKSNMLKRSYVLSILSDAGKVFNIYDVDIISKRHNVFTVYSDNNAVIDSRGRTVSARIDDSILEVIKTALPSQPWPVGLINLVIERTGFEMPTVKAGISILVNKGVFNRQKNGIVYDNDGNVIAKRMSQ